MKLKYHIETQDGQHLKSITFRDNRVTEEKVIAAFDRMGIKDACIDDVYEGGRLIYVNARDGEEIVTYVVREDGLVTI